MQTLWFRRCRDTQGWAPASPAGWLVLLGFIGLLIAGTAWLAYEVPRGTDVRLITLVYVVWVLLLGGGFIAIARMTGGRPTWRWGIRT